MCWAELPAHLAGSLRRLTTKNDRRASPSLRAARWYPVSAAARTAPACRGISLPRTRADVMKGRLHRCAAWRALVLLGRFVFQLDSARLATRDKLRGPQAVDGIAIDHHLLDVRTGGNLEHDIEEHFLDNRAQATSPCLLFERIIGGGFQGIRRKDELGAIQVQQLLILLDDRILRLGQDADQRVAVQVVERDGDGQASNELGDQAEFQQVVWNQLRQCGVAQLHRPFNGAEAHRLVAAEALLHDLVQPLEGAAADEENVLRVDLDEILVGMLAAALWRDVGNRALDDL